MGFPPSKKKERREIQYRKGNLLSRCPSSPLGAPCISHNSKQYYSVILKVNSERTRILTHLPFPVRNNCTPQGLTKYRLNRWENKSTRRGKTGQSSKIDSFFKEVPLKEQFLGGGAILNFFFFFEQGNGAYGQQVGPEY